MQEATTVCRKFIITNSYSLCFNKNLQTEIENTSEPLNSIPTNSATVPPASSAMSIIDEIADCDRRKKNIIVYNLPEPASNDKSDSDAFAAMCSSVYRCSYTITKSVHLGKKYQINIGHCYWAWKKKTTNFC